MTCVCVCVSEKIVKESEDFEGRDSGWTLDEILRLEVRTNHYSPLRGSSSFIEVPNQIAETKAIINVINKKDSQCFMWSILAALYPNTSNPNKTSSYVPHLNKLNFDGISFATPLNEHNEMCIHKSPARVEMPSETSFCYFISYQGEHYKDPVVYRGIDVPKIFIEKLEKGAIEIDNIYKKPKPLLPLTESEKQLYDNANNCYVVVKPFTKTISSRRRHFYLVGQSKHKVGACGVNNQASAVFAGNELPFVAFSLNLSHPALLKKCLGGKTQNPNESLNSLIWKFCPKTIGSSLQIAEIAANLATSVFNDGNQILISILEKFGLKINRNVCVSLAERDNCRIFTSRQRRLESSFEARRAKKIKE
ncbi:c2H2-type domain-containing protein [Trichonephila clavipes]|nr:c2H2-type domain-containing protein [Trichonephila clavipes]